MGPPRAKLQASGRVYSVVGLSSGGLAAGTNADTIDLWPNAEAVQRGGPPKAKLQASGYIYSVIELSSGGLAAGTNAETIDLWPDAQAVQRGGPPMAKLQASAYAAKADDPDDIDNDIADDPCCNCVTSGKGKWCIRSCLGKSRECQDCLSSGDSQCASKCDCTSNETFMSV